MFRIHLSRPEKFFAAIAGAIALVIGGVWVYSLACPLPSWLQGFNTTALIALGAAYIALGTYLANRHHRRRSLRRSVSRELELSVKQLAAFTKSLYSEDEINVEYSTFPDNILAAQLADLGQLSGSEIDHLSDYYSLAQIFKSQLSEIQTEGEMSTKDIHNSLSGTSTNDPLAVELVRRANNALDELDEDRSFDLDLNHLPDEEWDGEPIDIDYSDIIQRREESDNEY